MGKRNCKSKYRFISPDLSGFTSPRSCEPPPGSSQARRDSDVHDPPALTSSRSREPPPGSSQARRDSDVHDTNQSRVMFSKRSSHYFEVSDSPNNVHSPYYLHSSEHPGLVLTSDRLDGTNYETWFITMNTSIEAKNKLGFIDGSLYKPDDDDPYCKIWSRCYSMVKSWLLNSVTKKIYISILCFNIASDIWKDLHTRFHKSNLPRLYKQRQQIHSLRQGSLDLSAYHTQTQSLWAELTSLQATARTIEDLVAERETNRVIDFLMSLNDNYDTVRSQILMKKSLPSLSKVYNIIVQEESQKSARLPSHSSVDSSAFHTQVHSNPVHSGNHAGSSVMANAAVGEASDNLSSPSDELTPTQIQQLMSFLSTKLQSSSTTPEVHSVSAYQPPGYSPNQGDSFPRFYKYFAEVFLIVLVYVDDILIACDNDGAVDHLKHQLQSDILHSQFSEAPRKVHQQVFHKVLAYIKGTVGQGLFYPSISELPLIGYAYADYGSCLDTRRSTSGYCFFLGSWKSKKQQIVAIFSTEAEYKSRSTASDELVCLLNFLNALQVHLIAIAFERDGLHVCFSCGLFQLLHVRTNEQGIISITVSEFGRQDGSSHSFRPILRGTIDVYDADFGLTVNWYTYKPVNCFLLCFG